MILNSLNFCLSVKLFISPLILNEILAVYNYLGCRFFPFITLNIYCHSLLTCRVSAERSALNLMEIPFCYLLLFPCCFSFFFLFIFSLINMCVSLCGAHMQCVSPWIYPLWDSLCFLDLIDYQLLMWVQCLGQEDSIEAGIATHSSILAWRTPWTEQPGGLWSMGSQRVGDNCGNLVHMHTPVCLFLTFMSRMMKLVIISKIMGESGKELIFGGGKVPRFRVRTGM